MSDGKLIAAGLFAIAFALAGVGWSIHDNTVRQNRYVLDQQLRLDTLTGELVDCHWKRPGLVYCNE